MSNPQLTAKGFTCEELAETLMLKLRPFIQESIRIEIEKINGNIQPDIPPEKINGLTSDEPEVSNNGRYPTMVVCAILGVCYKTLIKYTDQGKIRCGIRKSNGRKFYLGSEIKRFWKATY